MAREAHRRVLVSVGIFSALLILTEAALHIAITPSPSSSGRVFGRELPPFKITPAAEPVPGDRSEQFRELVIGGEKITVGDLYGINREDRTIGYVPAENAVST